MIKKVHKFKVCHKIYLSKILLSKHEKIDSKNQQCSICHQDFRRSESFFKHRQWCSENSVPHFQSVDEEHNSDFTPSVLCSNFVRRTAESAERVELYIGLEE